MANTVWFLWRHHDSSAQKRGAILETVAGMSYDKGTKKFRPEGR
jgi:hypothetical protein